MADSSYPYGHSISNSCNKWNQRPKSTKDVRRKYNDIQNGQSKPIDKQGILDKYIHLDGNTNLNPGVKCDTCPQNTPLHPARAASCKFNHSCWWRFQNNGTK